MRETVQTWQPTDAQSLSEAIVEAVDLARSEGCSADVVNVEERVTVSLVRERLTDGSFVMNIGVTAR